MNSNKTTLLIAISGPGGTNTREEFNEIINGLNTIASEQKETHFILNKLHRKDKKSNYLGKQFLNIVDDDMIPEHISKLVPLLCNVDIVISGASTSVIEAMYLQKPVIIFDKNPKTKSLPFVEEGAVLFCTETEMLKQHISSLNNSGYLKECIARQNQFINEHFNITTDPAKIIAQQISTRLTNN
jgi:CDP-glycerol glycerophosphotransferase (TagB/SpsB family)